MLNRIRESSFVATLSNPNLLSLSIGHFSVDAFSNLLPVMYPMLMTSLRLDYGLIGVLVILYTCSSSLSQPLFGYIADKVGGRHLAALGIAWVATMLSLLTFAWDYWSLLVIITVAGFGIAAFHPQGAMNTSDLGGKKKATAMAVFMLGGNAGFALGPTIGATVFSTPWGLQGSMLLWIPGLLAALWVYKAIGKVDENRRALLEQADGSGQGETRVRVALFSVIALVVVVALRSWTSAALNNYMPLLLMERGVPAPWPGIMLTGMLLSMAVGGLVGAIIADATGGRKVVFISLLLTAPAVFLFLSGNGLVTVAAGLVGGFLIGSSTSVTLVMGQELMPQNAGMASGLVMGLAFAAGGAGAGLTGVMATRVGLTESLYLLCVLPLMAAALSLVPRGPKRQLGDTMTN